MFYLEYGVQYMVMWYLIAYNVYFLFKHWFYFADILCLYVRRYVLMYVYVYANLNKALSFTRA